MELDNYFEVLTAYMTLWVLEGETDYDLAVRRGGSTVHLYYSVYYVSP